MPAPGTGDRIEWPESFGTRFILFVDTEEEFDWNRPFDRASRGTAAMEGLPNAHSRFASQGVPVNYLIDHPIVSSPRAVEILKDCIADGQSTVGTQLHPWVNPPFDEEVSQINSFSANLPISLQAAKLRVLTDAIEAAFGARPTAYRAGRYGIGPETARMLLAEGYRVDTSMRSGYDYSGEIGPDFSAIPNHAFRVGELIELPFTTIHTGLFRGGGTRLHARLSRIPKGLGLAARFGLYSRVSLTPEEMPLEDALEAVRIAVGEGLQLLNFSFHSPSVVPGHTPYVRDATDLKAFHRWWDEVLALLDRRGARPIGLDALINAACGVA